ncbi:MAG TPA: hypothetical protein VF088_20590 [Pyrinomonadaceae bacterium]
MSSKAQVSFVQITDPHIFDDVHQTEKNPSQNEDNVLENRAALASLIGQINERELAGSKFNFIAVTGDLGIEALVLEPSSKDKTDAEKETIPPALLNDQIRDKQRELITNSLKKGARDLAGLIALSRVTLWLFVPGNNDVLGELPRHVRYYHEFMKELQASVQELNIKIKIVDLCPYDETSTGANYASTSKPFQLDGLKDYIFIGFNDSSFKNKKDNLIEINAAAQLNYVRQVSNQLQRGDFKYAYIFYHIPEIDDPWLVTQSRTDDPLKTRVARADLIGKSYFESSWFVRNDVREQWNLVVMNPKVKGLFAGHFHDSKPQSYQSFDWMRTNYPGETLSKLYVAPPIALRMQRHSLTHARGFREVFLDKDGSVKSRIVFLNNAQWDLAPGDAESERQLALAQTYSASGKKTEAAAAYAKAAESSWPPTRTAALASLQQLNNEENRWTRKYLLTPLSTGWSAGVNTFGALLVTIALSLLAIAIAWPFIQIYAERTGRNKLRVNQIIDSPNRGLGASFQQLIAQVHGTKAAHYKKRVWFDAPGKTFPVLAASQSAEVPELIETVVPGGLGKVIAWLYRKTDKPRYNLSGTIQTVSFQRSSLFVAVSGGGTAKRWRRSSTLHDLTDYEVIVAHAALDFLVKEINGGRFR